MRSIRIKTVTLVASLFCILLCNNSFAQDLQTAINFTKSEQYDEAEAIYSKLIQTEASNPRNYFYYGENVLLNYFSDTISNAMKVSMKQARDLFTKGVEVDGLNPLNYVGLAKVSFYLGEDQKAVEYRAKAKQLLPPYKKVAKIANRKEYSLTLAKIAESYIREEAVDTALAMPFVREAMLVDPTNPDVFIIAGDIFIYAKDASASIKNYNRAQNIDPTSPTSNMKIGSIYLKSRALSAAIPYYEQAIGQNANFAPAYRELGRLYSDKKDFVKAKEYYKKYLEITKGNLPAKVSYVNSLYYGKQYDDVITNVEEIFAIDQSRTYLNRIAAYSCYEKGNYEKGIYYINRLFKDMPEERIIQKDYTYKAKLLIKKNQNNGKDHQELDNLNNELKKVVEKSDAAKGPAKDAFKVQIDTLKQQIARAEVKTAKGDEEINQAFASYAKALEFTPTNRGLITEIAMANYGLKRNIEAANAFALLINPEKSEPSEYVQVGKLYYTGGALNKADSVFTTLTTKFPDYLPGYVWLANTYSAMDPDFKEDRAKAKFEQVIEKGSVDKVKNATEIFDAYRYMGYYYLTNKDYDKSKEYYTMMVELDPNNKDFQVKGYNSLGGMYNAQGLYQKAIDAYKQTLTVDPTNESAKVSIQNATRAMAQAAGPVNPNLLKGVVKNASGTPIASASVRVKDTAAETLTGLKGEFAFEIPGGSEALIVTAKGYSTKEVKITKSRVYTITLQ